MSQGRDHLLRAASRGAVRHGARRGWLASHRRHEPGADDRRAARAGCAPLLADDVKIAIRSRGSQRPAGVGPSERLREDRVEVVDERGQLLLQPPRRGRRPRPRPRRPTHAHAHAFAHAHARGRCRSTRNRRPCSMLLTPSADIRIIRQRSTSRYGESAFFRTHFSRIARWRPDTFTSTAGPIVSTSAMWRHQDPRRSRRRAGWCAFSAAVI